MCVLAWALLAVLATGARPADAVIVVINEIMYHPSQAQSDLEYVELLNDGPIALDLGGYYFSAGITYRFPGDTWIPPHGYLVVASSPTLARAAFPAATVVGPYAGKLDNGGEKLELRNASGGLVDTVTYKDSDPWPAGADGSGHSLSLIHPYLDNDKGKSWAISLTIGGTAGAPNFPTPPPAPTVVISEILANPTTPGQSWVELHNVSGAPLSLNGMFLSDDNNLLNFYQITGRVLPIDGYTTFTAAQTGFVLVPTTGTIFLTNPTRTRVIDAAAYGKTAPGNSNGRYFDAREHKEHWYEMAAPTPGAPNTVTLNDGVVINEIMYHPFSLRPRREYIELYNRTGAPISLTGWRLTNAVDYRFTTGTVINPGEFLVVAESTATLTAVYGLPLSQVVGNFRGQMNNDEDHVVLRDSVGNVADEVEYHDGGRWPDWADGMGSSLELIDPNQPNNFPTAWAASDDSSKSLWTFVQYTKKQMSANYPFESEFQMMLTDNGIALIDDLHMTAGGGGPELIANGDFEAGTAGWTVTGTHKYSTAVTGAANVHGGSRALKMAAVGRGAEGPDHLERDTAAPLTANAYYTVSYWARWLVGTNQLLTRTHFNGVAQTTPLPVPERLGTPGAPNSRYQPNLGPIIDDVHHTPVTPTSSQQVAVTAVVLDSNGVAGVTLYYKTDLAPAWNTVPMFDDGLHGDGRAGDGVYGASIPAQANNTLMEFYVWAQDSLGAFLTFPASDPPANPPPRRALYQVRDTPRTTTLKTFQLLINDDQAARLATRTGYNRMDNEQLDATFVLDDQWAFYNVSIRYKGSAYTRPTGYDGRPCYRIRFNSDEKLFGLLSVNLDNLNASADCRVNDPLVQWLDSKLTGVPTSAHEYVRVYRFCSNDSTPDRNHGVYDHVKRVDGGLVDDYFPKGSNGFLHKVDDHFEWTDAGAFTRRTSETAHLTYYGPDDEFYRWNFRPRSREIEDDFSQLTQLTRLFDLSVTDDTSFTANVEKNLDVHEWLKKWAVSAVVADWDTLGMDGGPRGKNAYIYWRSDLRKWLLLPWDSDLTFETGRYNFPIYPATAWFANERRLMTHPNWGRWYLYYINRLLDGPFSAAEFNAQYNRMLAVLQAENDVRCAVTRFPDYQTSRSTWLRRNVLPQPTPFEITTNLGQDFAVDTTSTLLQGTGDLQIFSFKVNGRTTTESLWIDGRVAWQINNIALATGPNPLVVTGHDYRGTTVSMDSITVFRYGALHTLPYGTSFEPTEAPPFRVGPLPQNDWVGAGNIQNTQVAEGVQAVGIQDGFAEYKFEAEGSSVVLLDGYVRTAGTTEPTAISNEAGPFAAQLFFSRAQGIQALDGDSSGSGTWRNAGVALDPARFLRLTLQLNYSTQRWDLSVDGAPALTNLGFAWPRTQLNKFRYYSDVFGAFDRFEVTTQTAQPQAPRAIWEPQFTSGTANRVLWGTVYPATAYYLEWSTTSTFATVAGNSGWIATNTHPAGPLSDGATYYFRVKCRDAALAESPWSNVVSSTQDALAPATAVSPLPAYEIIPAFNVAWSGGDPVTGLASVRLYYRRNGAGPFQYGGAFTASPIWFNTALTGRDGNYTFWTVGTDRIGNVEAAPGAPDAQTTVLTLVPGPPPMFTEPPYTPGLTNTITWTPTAGAAAYYLEWATSSLFSPPVGNSGWIAATNFTATNLNHATGYFFHVKARNAALVEGAWSGYVVSVQDNTAPQSIILPLPPVTKALSFTLNCQVSDIVSGVRETRLYWRRGGTGPYFQWPQPFVANQLTFNAGLAGGYGLYEFYSVATDNVNNVEAAPARPEAATVLYPPGPTGAPRWKAYR